MTIEKKAKWRMRLNHAGAKIKKAVPWIIGGGLWLWGVGGINKAHKDHKEIATIKNNICSIANVVDHNANAGNLLRERVSVLERQNNELLTKALNITEGKT